MAKSSDNKALLALIAVILVAILGLLVYQTTKKTPEEKIADSVSDTLDSIGSAVSKKTGN
jgi:sensor domain CHASE-containing protein